MRKVVLKLCVVLGVVLATCGCQEPILHELPESQANQVLVALARADIAAEKVREAGGWSVAVSSSAVTKALEVLDGDRVIRPRTHGLEDSGGFIRSHEERMRSLERNLATSLEQTLERIPGVLEARVHLHFDSEKSLQLLPEEPKHSASVVLLMLDPARIEREHVRTLVSGASGIGGKDISVIAFETQLTEPKSLSASDSLGRESVMVQKVSATRSVKSNETSKHKERMSETDKTHLGGGFYGLSLPSFDLRQLLWLLPLAFVISTFLLVKRINRDRQNLKLKGVGESGGRSK